MVGFKNFIMIIILISACVSCLYKPPYTSGGVFGSGGKLIAEKSYSKEDTIYLQDYFLCHLIHWRFRKITDTLPWSDPEVDPFPLEIPVNKDSLLNELYLGLKKTGLPIVRIPAREEGECPVYRDEDFRLRDIDMEAIYEKSFDCSKKVLIPFINIYHDVRAIPGGFATVNIKRNTVAKVYFFIVQNKEVIYRRYIYYADGKYTLDPFDPLFYMDRENWEMLAYYGMRPYIKRME